VTLVLKRASTRLDPEDMRAVIDVYHAAPPATDLWVFVEGFDTTPLKDAKALLGELMDLAGTQTQARRG
jgi:hypothetical protein